MAYFLAKTDPETGVLQTAMSFVAEEREQPVRMYEVRRSFDSSSAGAAGGSG